MQTAQVSHVAGDSLAKAVILEDDRGLLMAVVPSDYHVDLAELGRELNRRLAFAEEDELAGLFPDCDLGAIPPIGPAYGIPTIWDTNLGKEGTVFFEAGDHETLIEVSGKAFHELMAPAIRGHFALHS